GKPTEHKAPRSGVEADVGPSIPCRARTPSPAQDTMNRLDKNAQTLKTAVLPFFSVRWSLDRIAPAIRLDLWPLPWRLWLERLLFPLVRRVRPVSWPYQRGRASRTISRGGPYHVASLRPWRSWVN